MLKTEIRTWWGLSEANNKDAGFGELASGKESNLE